MRPTERTLNYLRKHYPRALSDVVERWIPAPTLPGGGLRRDLFGIIDIVSIRDGRFVGIQCSGYTAIKKHLDKIEESPAAITWLAAGGLLEIWAFKKTVVGKRNSYTPRIVPVVMPNYSIVKNTQKPVTELFQ